LTKEAHPKLKEINEYRIELLKNDATISFTDFGAGSRTNQGNTRSIKEIAKISGTPSKYANLLSKLSDHYNSSKVLELGTSLGIGTLSLNNDKNQVTTLEGDESVFNFTKQQHSQLDIRFMHTLFDDFIEKDSTIYDVIFIDGNHSKEATLKYAKELQKNSHKDSIFIFDDINWSKGMQEAWSEIIKSPDFNITIDLFKFGICFKADQKKEHFILRY
jgi:predicted O-methyltransferase YrrM